MSDLAIEVDSVWKKFHRGEFHDSLRDFVPALARRLVGRGPKQAELSDGDFWALKDVSFQVRRGEVLGIIGRNGAGKSTLLKILSKILKPNRGQIRVSGRLRALIEVAAGFHPDLTGRENVYLNGSILGMKKREIDAKFDEIVEFSGIGEFLDTPVKRYSSGMHARLGFAVAAHLDPEILIVDEVLAVGDYKFQKKCFGKMSDVSRSGQTVLVVSHNMGSIAALCERCLWIDRGEVQMVGPTTDLIARYLTASGNSDSDGGKTEIRADRGEGILRNIAPSDGCLHVRCGESVVVEFLVEVSSPVEHANASVVLLDENLCPVVAMSSLVQNVPSQPGRSHLWKVRCDMGHIPLNAHTYYTRVHFGDLHREIARFSNVHAITIQEYDVYGWGSALPSVRSWGHFFWAPNWDIRPD